MHASLNGRKVVIFAHRAFVKLFFLYAVLRTKKERCLYDASFGKNKLKQTANK